MVETVDGLDKFIGQEAVTLGGRMVSVERVEGALDKICAELDAVLIIAALDLLEVGIHVHHRDVPHGGGGLYLGIEMLNCRIDFSHLVLIQNIMPRHGS